MIAPARPEDPFDDEAGPPIDLRSVAVLCWHRGMTGREIAEAIGRPASVVAGWLDAASAEGRLGPPPHERAFGLRLDCRCVEDPFKPGERLVCVVCTRSGWDFHPRMHAEPLPRDRKAYRPGKLKGGAGDAAADDAAAPGAVEAGKLGARAGRCNRSRGRRR